ncbi:MAG TPA: hypothetical protein VKB16_16055 [Beijerinckiaceae bacterium]|nr:hypothetical protein [Beijerinckiaceae bacterium]
MTIEWIKSLWEDGRRLRRLLLLVDVGLIAFWPYLIAWVIAHPAEKGSDGFEVFAVIPVTLIALFLSLPALLLLVSNRTLRIGAWVTLAAIATNILFFSNLRSNSLLVREWHCRTFWTLCW